MNKKLLYIDHSFHNKTKSAKFLEEILSGYYNVDYLSIDPDGVSWDKIFESLKGEGYAVLVLFQVMPNIEMIKKNICFEHGVFFPMFDGSGSLDDKFWEAYKNFNIINFSRTLHERLLCLGLSSYYIQYFPEPFKSFEPGNPTSVFFWQRVSDLNIILVEKILKKFSFSKIHIHRALDPHQCFYKPSDSLTDKIEYSDWYETRGEMLKDVESCAIYIAPRPYEGIGMSFLEAMAMGRCVIAPDHPTMSEYIVNGINGILYDFHLPKPVKLDNIERIQSNAVEYIRQGYIRWERDKYKIIEWLEAPLQQNKPLLVNRDYEYMSVKSWCILGHIPFLTIKNKPNKRFYYLFGILGVLKSKRKTNQITFYLFGFIPIWKMK